MLGAATLKLMAPNEVQTTDDGIFDNLRENDEHGRQCVDGQAERSEDCVSYSISWLCVCCRQKIDRFHHRFDECRSSCITASIT